MPLVYANEFPRKYKFLLKFNKNLRNATLLEIQQGYDFAKAEIIVTTDLGEIEEQISDKSPSFFKRTQLAPLVKVAIAQKVYPKRKYEADEEKATKDIVGLMGLPIGFIIKTAPMEFCFH